MVGCTKRSGNRAKVRFAEPPWNERSDEWQVRDRQVGANHPAREVLEAMKQLDLTPLFGLYLGAGKPPIRPDLMLRVVLIEIRRGRPRPGQWFRDVKENNALQWAGFGIQPSRMQPCDLRAGGRHVVRPLAGKRLLAKEEEARREAACSTNPNRGRAVKRSEHEALVEAHRARMATPEAKDLYRLRGQTVELGFADFKQHRSLRQFSGRGRDRAQRQVGLTVLAHNLLVVHHAQPPPENTAAAVLTPEEIATYKLDGL